MDELVKQVELLKATMEALIERAEQIFHLQEERLQRFLTEAEAMLKTKESLDLTIAALQQSLSENDQLQDAQAKITAALVQIVKPALQKQQQQ